MRAPEIPASGQHERLVIALDDAPDPAAKHAAGEALYRHNIAQTGLADRRPIAATVTDPDTGAVIGGLWGGPSWASCSSTWPSCPRRCAAGASAGAFSR